MQRKYELTDQGTFYDDRLVIRIRALRDFADVKKGDLGGFIEEEENLAHSGNCWVYDKAMVCGKARVRDNATIRDSAVVSREAVVHNDAVVGGTALVTGRARILGNATVQGAARVSGSASVVNHAVVQGDACVQGSSLVADNAVVHGGIVLGSARLEGDSVVEGGFVEHGYFDGHARIEHSSDYFVAFNVGTETGMLTMFRTRHGVMVTRGCFTGRPSTLLKRSAKHHDAQTHKEYQMLIAVGLSRLGVKPCA